MIDRSIELNTKGLQYLEKQDYIAAFKYFYEASAYGNQNAIYNVGYCYFNGYGVAKNYERALHFLGRFVGTNSELSTNAEFLCGVIFHNGGYGIKSDKSRAMEMYYKAANKGHQWSMCNYGKLLAYTGDYSGARQILETIIRSNNQDEEVLNEAKKIIKLLNLKDFRFF